MEGEARGGAEGPAISGNRQSQRELVKETLQELLVDSPAFQRMLWTGPVEEEVAGQSEGVSGKLN